MIYFHHPIKILPPLANKEFQLIWSILNYH